MRRLRTLPVVALVFGIAALAVVPSAQAKTVGGCVLKQKARCAG